MEGLIQSTRREILTLLKRRGGQTVKDLSAALGITAMGVRQHLATLERDNLVVAEAVRRGRGRPSQVYRLTEAGHELFPRSYASLATKLLEDVAALNGQESVDRLLDYHTRRLAGEYRERLKGKDFPEAVQELGRIRDQEGYLVDIEQVDPDTFRFIEHNCAVHNVAHRHRQLCHCELRLFQEVLGAEVVREERILDGQASCQYLIRRRA